MKKLTTLVSTVSFFVTLGFALESFLLVLLRGNAKIVSKALVPPAVYKALRVFMSRRYVTGIPSIFSHKTRGTFRQVPTRRIRLSFVKCAYSDILEV